MPVRKLIREDVLTIDADKPVFRAAELMRNNNVGSLVVTKDETPIGVLTDRDLALRVVSQKRDPESVSVSQLVGGELVSGSPGDRPEQIFQQMKEAGLRRLPIVSGDDLLGIVTMDDLIFFLRDRLEDMTDIIAFESPPYKHHSE